MTTATTSRTNEAMKGVIRPFERQDVGAVARLRDVARFDGPGQQQPRLEAYLTDLFFDAPCQVESPLHAFVYQDAAGRINGFLGTHPRTFIYEDRPITAAACGQLMLHPDVRGQRISYHLIGKFYEGSQEFSFHGTASRSRAMHRSLGAHNPPFYGIYWRKTLRPLKSFARRASVARRLGMLRYALKPFVRNAGPTRGSGQGDMPDLADVEAIHRRAFAGARLYPAFDARDMEWKLRTVMGSDRPGTFARVVRYGTDPIGWYVWLLDREKTGTVIEMLATPDNHGNVIRELMQHARRAGAESIGGFCSDTAEALAVQTIGASLAYTRSTYIIHSRNSELLRLFLDDPLRLSVFDGEGWLDFPRG